MKSKHLTYCSTSHSFLFLWVSPLPWALVFSGLPGTAVALGPGSLVSPASAATKVSGLDAFGLLQGASSDHILVSLLPK